MATLYEGVRIFQGPNAAGVIGLTASFEDSSLIVTKDRNVDIYKVGDTKPLSSWSSKLSSQFTCPVIFSPSLSQFIGVYNKKSLVRWTHETRDLLKVKSSDVGSEVSAVLTREKSLEPIMVFCNGWVEEVSSVLTSLKKTRTAKLPDNEQIKNQWLVTMGEDQYVVLLTKNNTEYSVVTVSPSVHGGDIQGRFTLPRPDEMSSVCDSCLFQQGTSSSLYLLWSDGSIIMYDTELPGMIDEVSILEGQTVLQLSSREDVTKVCIEPVQEDFLAVSGICHLNSSLCTANSAHLTIWNTTFGTVHACVPMSGQSNTEGGRHLFHLHDHLIVSSPTSLTCHAYQCQNISLAEALGKLSVEDHNTGLSQEWNTEQTSTGISSSDVEATKRRVLKALLQPHQVKSSYKKDVQFLVAHCPSACLEILKTIGDKYKQGKEPLPAKQLQVLIRTNKVAGSACPELLSVILDRGDTGLALECLENMQDLPEPFLAQCLGLFLSPQPDSTAVNGTLGGKETKVCPLSHQQAVCIDKVLVCPFNTIFLLSGIKKLAFSSILLFLRYLDFLMVTGRFGGDKQVTEDTLVDWISVTLDAHFTQLVLTPEAKDVLRSLQKCVHQHVKLYAGVSEVNRMVEAMKVVHKHPTKNTKDEGTYSVEILQL